MLESLLHKAEGLKILGTSILKTSANGCLVHNMSLKHKILNKAQEPYVNSLKVRRRKPKSNARNAIQGAFC